MGSIAPGSAACIDARPLALLLPTLEPGGAERAVSALAAALAARGEQVDLVVGRVVGPHGRALVPTGVRLVELGTRRVVTSFRALRSYLVREQPTALLTNLTHANAMALLTARCGAPGVRVVAVEHSTLSVFARTSGPLRHRLLPLMARATYRHADAIVAVSRGARSELARTIGLPESRIEQIPNALPVDQLRRRAADPSPHSWLEPGAPAVLLGIGSLRPVKGYSRLLHAFAALRGRRRARLVILGEGPERRRLERLAGTLGVRDDVRFPGTVENPYPWIARSGGLVLTSSAEGLPTVLLEALALGRPVVAVDCPSGPREILDGGRLGRLVPQDDQEALVEGMAWAVDRRRISIPDEMIAPYDPDHVAERYLRLLRPQSLPIGEPIPA